MSGTIAAVGGGCRASWRLSCRHAMSTEPLPQLTQEESDYVDAIVELMFRKKARETLLQAFVRWIKREELPPPKLLRFYDSTLTNDESSVADDSGLAELSVRVPAEELAELERVADERVGGCARSGGAGAGATAMREADRDRWLAEVEREGDYVVAQCLDVDVSSFGASEAEALANLREALELYFEDAPSGAPRL